MYATKQISAGKRALVQDVIPYIDILTNHVNDFTKDVSVSPIVRAAARHGRLILDKYYKCTDETIIYRIAMTLHPKHKLQYFWDQEWTEEWINNTVEVICKEWRTHYKPKPAAANVDHQAPSGKDKGKGKVPGPGRQSAQQSQDATIAMFATVNGSDKAAKADALESYLESPQQTTVTDPLEHWSLMLQTPEAPLARMALDYLSVPATSTDTERAFSRGHLTISRLRHALNDSSVRAGTVLGSWANIPDLVPEAEVVDLLKAHARKSERAVKDTVSSDTVSTAAASSQQAAVSTVKATSSKTATTSVKGKARAALSAAGSTVSVAHVSSSVARVPSSNTRGRASSLNARASSSNAHASSSNTRVSSSNTRASSSNTRASSSKSAARSKGSRAIVITDSEEDTE